ncbi:MAG: anthranilate phosphoribosyltransferase [Deltaproteobacteria bacterium]|nr:anthranilate phosphoribosyltransferase [Deltaproteobacteria bacterium]
MIKQAIRKVVRGEDLQDREMEGAMEEILDNRATSAQIGAFIAALRIKGETVIEITAAARALRSRAAKVQVNNSQVNLDRDEINLEKETILDTCGTGGDGTNTFNISTATAFVAAGGGVRVAKHGNRAVSSRCGSADVLSNLGVRLDINRSHAERCIREIGIGFLYAPLFHSAMKHAAAPRQEVGIRSIFNLLGPLTNPAGATTQVLGVYRPELTEIMAGVLDRLGCREAFVVCGDETLDEISICGPTRVSHLKGARVRTFHMEPEEFGLERADPRAIRGGTARENARIIREILAGEKGPRRDVVVMNAAAAFVAAGVEPDFRAGAGRAVDAIDSGRAREKLEDLIRCTQDYRPFVRGEILAA